jgi:fluoride ion exporter CrcB/FEX
MCILFPDVSRILPSCHDHVVCAQKVAAVLGLGSYSTYSTVFSSSILALLIEQNKSLSCLLSNWCMLVHVGVCWCIIGDCQTPMLREPH